MMVAPEYLTDLMVRVLLQGAISSGTAGVDWRIGDRDGKPCSPTVTGLRKRGFITTTTIMVNGQPALMTVITPAGSIALRRHNGT